MKRQGLTTTPFELRCIADELDAQGELDEVSKERKIKFQLNVINKTPECSDTWEFEK